MKVIEIYILKEKSSSKEAWVINSCTIFPHEAKEWKAEHSPRSHVYREYEMSAVIVPEHVWNEEPYLK